MKITRFLKEEFIDVEIADGVDVEPPDDDEEEEDEARRRRWIERVKQEVLERLCALLARSGKIGNESKLFNDLWNREKKATMAVGGGVAIPHVRTMQAKDFAMAIGVAREGIEWDAPDSQPVRIFIAMVGPPYEDRLYLQVWQRVGRLFEQEHAAEAILAAQSPGEIIRWIARAAVE